MINEIKDSSFKMMVNETVKQLKNRNLTVAGGLINEMASISMNAPEPHNLYGILSEMRGDISNAKKHYRAASALDPAYKPAIRNLERLVMFDFDLEQRGYDYGEVYE